MNFDDPFGTSDLDNTIIMPTPRGRIPSATQSAKQWQSAKPLENLVEIEQLSELAGLNTLVAIANPLLNSVPQLRTTLQHADPAGLQNYLVQHIKVFEKHAKANGIQPEKMIAARYVLCTLLDETIASTPWGSGEWSKHSLLVMFHSETSGGEKFFQLLTKLAEDPKTNLDILELMYICLILGFEGRYRLMDNGRAQLDTLRERLAQILSKQRGEYERDLSPHWQAAPSKRGRLLLLLPIWVLFSICGLVLVTTYISFSFLLNSVSDPVFAKIQSIQTQNNIPKQITTTTSSLTPELTRFLAQEIEQGTVAVHDKNGHSIITLLGDGVFAPGRSTISNSFLPILTRVAEVLSPLPSQVQILGHTDNQPIRSARFPSNWHLSQDRAHAVMQLLKKKGLSANRLSAEGRADIEPIASNSTSEGRKRNRRVEIVVIGSFPSQ